MEYFELILQYLEVCIWPIVVILSIIIFRKPIDSILTRIESLKIGKLHAELTRTISDAKDVLNLLRDSIEANVVTNLDFLTSTGRISSMNISEKFNRKNELDEICRKLCIIERKAIVDASDRFITMITWDHIDFICRLLQKYTGFSTDAIKSISNKIDRKSNIFPSVEQVRELLEPHKNIMDEEVENAILDYEYILNNKELRRPSALNYDLFRGKKST